MTNITDYINKKENKIAEEREKNIAEFQRIETEIESIDYIAAFRAAGLIEKDYSGVHPKIQAHYDEEQLNRLLRLNERPFQVLCKR